MQTTRTSLPKFDTAHGPVKVRQLSDVLGAEIVGVDLAGPGIEAAMDAIRRAFRDHNLLLFREQNLTDSDMASFTGRFGEVANQIVRHADGKPFSPTHFISNLDADGKPSSSPYVVANYAWHTDHAFRKTPALLTMLYGLEIPPSGGDTEFADMTKAYDALPETTKRHIDGLRAEHSYEYMRRTVTDRPASDDELRDAPSVIHPLVRTHPETGRKSIYIGMYCARIVGWAEDEGRKLIEELLAHATQPQFVFRHTWRLHDVIMWDNRCLMHRAIPNYDIAKQRRVMQRINIRGSVPE